MFRTFSNCSMSDAKHLRKAYMDIPPPHKFTPKRVIWLTDQSVCHFDGHHYNSEVAGFPGGHWERNWKYHSREILSSWKISKHKTCHIVLVFPSRKSIFTWQCVPINLGTMNMFSSVCIFQVSRWIFCYVQETFYLHCNIYIWKRFLFGKRGLCFWSWNDWSYFAT